MRTLGSYGIGAVDNLWFTKSDKNLCVEGMRTNDLMNELMCGQILPTVRKEARVVFYVDIRTGTNVKKVINGCYLPR